MPVDPKKLKEFQKELEDRTDNTKGWLYANKIKEPVDIRVLDPLPNLEGRYFLEIPCHWVNGKRMMSPAIFGEVDPMVKAMEEIVNHARTDADVRALLNKTGKAGKLVSERVEYWLPVIQLQWKIVDDAIQDIYGPDDQFDVNLIEQFVKDKTAKVFVTGSKLMAGINKIVTTRGGHVMFDLEKGFNLIVSKAGEGRQTEYSAVQSDAMPMPKKYYQPENVPDLVKLCKAGIRTDEYMLGVLYNYFYGEPLPDSKDESTYRYPEARADAAVMAAHAELESESPENPPAPAQEPSPEPPARTAATPQASSRRPIQSPTAPSTRPGAASRATGPVRPGAQTSRAAGNASTGTNPGPASPGGPRRNLLDDVKE